jgi:hypothetical protein
MLVTITALDGQGSPPPGNPSTSARMKRIRKINIPQEAFIE